MFSFGNSSKNYTAEILEGLTVGRREGYEAGGFIVLNIFEALKFINWHPGIGDPTIIGWIITLVYLFTHFTSRDFWIKNLLVSLSANN